MRHIVWTAIIIVLALIALPLAAAVPQPLVPMETQYSLFLKILAFDREFSARLQDDVVIGIVYREELVGSVIAKDALLETARRNPMLHLRDTPVQWMPITMEDKEHLSAIIQKRHVDVIYVTPLPDADIRTIVDVCRSARTITLTGVPEHVRSGIAVGLGIKSRRPQILVNLQAAKAEGCDFSSRLLKLAKVIR